MLIPRFSLRQLLTITTASAVFCYLLAMAARGHAWAIAISVAISSVLCALIVYATVFAVAWVLTLIGLFTKQNVAASPFANAAPPPQFITPPEDQE